MQVTIEDNQERQIRKKNTRISTEKRFGQLQKNSNVEYQDLYSI